VSVRLEPGKETTRVLFGFSGAEEAAEWTCSAQGYSSTDDLYVDLYGLLEEVEMPLDSGSVGSATGRDGKFIESITITVIDRPVGQ
jgi:hypothetical protein